MGKETEGGSRAPAPHGSAVVGLAGRLLGTGYRHSAAHACCRPLFGGRRIRISVAFAKAVATEQEDLGVLDQPVGDGGSDGGVVEDVAPVGEGCVSGNDGGSFVAVARGDDLVKEIRALLIER